MTEHLRGPQNFLLGALLVTALASLLAPHSATAYPVHRRLFKVAYGKSVRCELCHGHGGGTERNHYGKLWQKKGESLRAFEELEPLDPDGDGFKTLDELKAGSNPGDPRSVPGKPGRRWNRRQKLPVPAEQLSLVMKHVDSFEALEPELTPGQLALLEKRLRRRLQPADKYPTLYFGVVGKRRKYVAMFRHFGRVGQPFSLLVALTIDAKVARVALFRSGDHPGSLFAPYLTCLRGHGAADLPRPGQAGCPPLAGHDRAVKSIVASIGSALHIVTALFSRQAK